MKECRIKISRYNPEKDKAPIFEEYKVPYSDQETVLEALLFLYEEIDSTLFFNYGCRYRSCGKCAIKINGNPGLACETPLADGMILEPLDNLPIIRDLGVDRSGLIEPLRKHSIVFSPGREKEVVIQPQEFFNLTRCNECLSCISTCPVYGQNTGYGGPFFGSKLAKLYYDVREGEKQLGDLESFLDECIQCRQCDVVCPWDVNFSEISTKIKGKVFEQEKPSIRDWLISHPPVIGYFASPFSPIFNTLAKKKSIRKIMDRLIKIDMRMPLPEYFTGKTHSPKRRKREAKRKAAYFAGCYDKFNDLKTLEDSLFALDANGVEVMVSDLGCCGMPFIGIGDLESAKKRAAKVSSELRKLILDGYDIVSGCTPCGAMIKIEYPTLFQLLEGEEFQRRIYDLGAYFWQLKQSGELNAEFRKNRRKLGYHVSCHLKVQKNGIPFVNLLRLIPGLEVENIFSKCCGMAGTMGFKKEKYELSQIIGNSLINEIKDSKLDLILSDCPSCRMKIKNDAKVNCLHPIAVFKEAMQ